MSTPILLEISKELLEEANIHSKQRMEFEYNRAGYNLDIRKSMVLIGTIGQLGFKKYLDSLKNIEYDMELQAGKYDSYDFIVNKRICEIKTSGYFDYWHKLNLLYSKDQFFQGTSKNFDVCFQLFINGYNRKTKILNLSECNQLVIAGFIKFSDIGRFKNPTPLFWGDDFKIPLDKLDSVENFFMDLK